MNIILATEVIHPGGAETFVLRLSRALQEKGHKVWLFVFYKNMFNEDLHRQLAPEVPALLADIPLPRLTGKIDGLLFRLGIDKSIRKYFITRSLRKHIKVKNIEAIHSNLLKVDEVCTKATEHTTIPVVATIHGDYLQFYEKTREGRSIPLLGYQTKARKNLDRLSSVVCISDKQIDFFRTVFKTETKGKLKKIYNGYAGKINTPASELAAKAGIKPGAFVFGMVSRGIPEKGWSTAIEAFQELNDPDTHLVLVGKSGYLDELRAKYGNSGNIFFAGHSDNPIEWINIFNVGLLPTTYASESLPTVVIEYLFCNKPVIASDAGEIRNMIISKDKHAGQIIKMENGTVDSRVLTQYMQAYLSDKELYMLHKENTTGCFSLFDMEKCTESYEQLYKQRIENIQS